MSSPRSHEYPIDVRWGEMDALGHVNSVAYLVYFESARVEMMRPTRDRMRKQGLAPVMAQSNICYLRSAVYPARLKVVTTVSRIGNTSMSYRQQLRDRESDIVYCEGEIVTVWIDRKDNKPRPIPDFVKEWLAQTS